MIRLAQAKDLPEILAIYNDAIVNTTAIYRYAPVTLGNRQEWFAQQERDGCPVFVYEQDGRAVGFATWGSFRPYPAYKYTVEDSVYVRSDCRLRGIGNQLLARLIEAADRRYAVIVAGIDSENAGSIRLHEKFGFRRVGTVTRAGFKFGRWLDLAFYQLDLTGPASPSDG